MEKIRAIVRGDVNFVRHPLEMTSKAVGDWGSVANERVVFHDTDFGFDAVEVGVIKIFENMSQNTEVKAI